MQTALFYVQIASAILLALSILLQNKSAGLSATFGGSGSGFSSKRGVDKLLVNATIFFALIFFGGALAYLFV
ncbi:MAG: preprotein translocase subunit SecG [Candidatus Peribacteraceae bacterium]|nr:preprotein translocase subunit SecG [Candidatus Peribacteraceae bacterium]